jgi:hypothetical protein
MLRMRTDLIKEFPVQNFLRDKFIGMLFELAFAVQASWTPPK